MTPKTNNIQDLIGDFDPETLSLDQLSDLYNQLTEEIESLEKERETLGSLFETGQTFDHDSGVYLEDLRDKIEDLSDPESGSKSPDLRDDLEDLEREIERVRYSLTAVSEISYIVFLGLTPIIVSEITDLETRPEISILLTGLYRIQKTQDLIKSLTETLDSLDLEYRYFQDRQIESLDLLESLSETADLIFQSYDLFVRDLTLRQKRLTVHYYQTKDRKTGEIVSESLRERVSVSFLDSGGSPKYDPETGQYIGSDHGYGRHFEKNRLRDFESESRVFVSVFLGDLEVSINLFHFLTETLEYDPIFDGLFLEYGQTPDNDRESWLSLGHTFVKDLADLTAVSGIYGESDPISDNTYNLDTRLSQDFQYHYLTIDQESRVLVSVHNGCDIRGGYARPIVYKETRETGLLDFQRLTMILTDPERPEDWPVYFDTDDSWHYYPSMDDQRLDDLPYDFRTRSDRLEETRQIERLQGQIDQVWSIIQDYIETRTLEDLERPEVQEKIETLISIHDRKTKDLERLKDRETIKYRRHYLTLDHFLCVDSSQILIDLEYDPESLIERYSDPRPVIYYRTNETGDLIRDPETGDPRLSISGLGDLVFSF